MKTPYVEFTTHKLDYFDTYPKNLDNDFDHKGKLALVDAYGLIFADGENFPPHLFVRHGNPNRYRFGGVCKLNENPIGLQTPIHFDDMAQDEVTGEFRKLLDCPDTFGYGTEKPFSEYRYTEKSATWKEGDFLDVKATPFPYCVIQHQGDIANFTEIIQPAIVEGMYNGKHVEFIGSYDKVFMPSEKTSDIGSDMAYILVLDHGIRMDGRKESVVIYINAEGKSMGGYYLEGEEPVCSTNVKMEADWFHLPYVDDGTIGYKDATFTIGNKVIHFEGKWGTKGITANPRPEKHGQSQIFGTWYEGDVPYKHKMFTTFHENMEAFDYKFKKLGFNIID